MELAVSELFGSDVQAFSVLDLVIRHRDTVLAGHGQMRFGIKMDTTQRGLLVQLAQCNPDFIALVRITDFLHRIGP
ncbi:hypothetical protein D3C73_1591750 [compost metagenome]